MVWAGESGPEPNSGPGLVSLAWAFWIYTRDFAGTELRNPFRAARPSPGIRGKYFLMARWPAVASYMALDTGQASACSSVV